MRNCNCCESMRHQWLSAVPRCVCGARGACSSRRWRVSLQSLMFLLRSVLQSASISSQSSSLWLLYTALKTSVSRYCHCHCMIALHRTEDISVTVLSPSLRDCFTPHWRHQCHGTVTVTVTVTVWLLYTALKTSVSRYCHCHCVIALHRTEDISVTVLSLSLSLRDCFTPHWRHQCHGTVTV